ncbi:MAG TPA: hypothetical protein VFZ61_30245 [Polyangiales bacterium]
MRSAHPVRLARLIGVAPHLVFALLAASLLVVAELSSRNFQRLMQEDGWAEWATFAAFAVAGTLALRRVRALRWGPERVIVLGLCAFCLFVAGEEISWGQRLLGYRPPRFFLQHNFQQEANLHNLLKDILDTRHVVLIIALAYGVLAPVVRYVMDWPRYLAPSLTLIPYFALVAWLEFSYPFELVGELAELLLGLSFAFDLAERGEPAAPPTGARLAALAQAGALAGGLLLLPLSDAIVELHAARFTQAAGQELAQLGQQLVQGGLVQDQLFRRRHVHKRVYTAARAGYLALPRDDYALDPWNNPYWVAFRQDAESSGRVLVYSFGPNHRRDSDIDRFGAPEFGLGGDDLGVVVEVMRPARTALQTVLIQPSRDP